MNTRKQLHCANNKKLFLSRTNEALFATLKYEYLKNRKKKSKLVLNDLVR